MSPFRDEFPRAVHKSTPYFAKGGKVFPQAGCSAGAFHIKISPHATHRAWDGSHEHGGWTAAFINDFINIIETLLGGYVMFFSNSNNCTTLSLSDSVDLSQLRFGTTAELDYGTIT